MRYTTSQISIHHLYTMSKIADEYNHLYALLEQSPTQLFGLVILVLTLPERNPQTSSSDI